MQRRYARLHPLHEHSRSAEHMCILLAHNWSAIMRAMRLLVGVGIAGLIACGESAEDQCKDVIDAVCDKIAECSDLEGDAALDLESQCLRTLKPSCEGADNELDSVDECVDAIKGASCDDFEAGDGEFTPPLQRACTK